MHVVYTLYFILLRFIEEQTNGTLGHMQSEWTPKVLFM